MRLSKKRKYKRLSDDDMARVKVLLLLSFYGIFSAFHAELMCEVANVKVESEDGRTQMFEMKKLEPTKGEACTLCAHPAVNLAPQISALKSQLVLSVADKELSPECGTICYYSTLTLLMFLQAPCHGPWQAMK